MVEFLLFTLTWPIKSMSVPSPRVCVLWDLNIWYFDGNDIIIVEITWPYCQLSETNNDRKSTLYHKRWKDSKYKNLVDDCLSEFHLNTILEVVIVSSLGAVPNDTIKTVRRLAKCNAKKVFMNSRQFSIVAIREKMTIFKSSVRHSFEELNYN